MNAGREFFNGGYQCTKVYAWWSDQFDKGLPRSLNNSSKGGQMRPHSMAHVDFQVACGKDAISPNHRIDSSSGDLNGDEEDGDSLEASSIDNTKAGNTIDKHELNQVVTLPANSKISKVKPKSK